MKFNQIDPSSSRRFRFNPLAVALHGALLTLCAGLPSQAHAQAQGQAQAQAPTAAQPDSDGGNTLPSVRVNTSRETAAGKVNGFVAKRSASGTKTDSALVETPQSISVIGADEVQARGANNIKEAIGYTPGVTPSASFDLREDLTSMRGFPNDWAALYLDGLQMPSSTYSISTVEPYGMERIEVLRGPASTLYGQTSTGGLINMVSKRPTSTPLHEVKLSMGNHKRSQLSFDFGGPIGQSPDSEWSYRLTGIARKSDTAVDFVEDNRLFLAPALTWRPSARTSLTLLASTMTDDLGNSGGTQAFLPASGIALPNPNGRIRPGTYGGEPAFDAYKKKQHSVGYDLSHEINDTLTLQQNLRVRQVKVDYQTAYGGGLDPADPTERTLTRSAFGSFGGTDSVSADTRLQARFSQGRIEHTVLVGLDLRRTQVDERNYFGAGPSIDIFAPVYGAAIALPATPYVDQTIESKQVGVYLQDQIKFDKRWLLTLGARWDSARSDVSERTTPYAFKTKENKTTGRAGLSYVLDNGVVPYVSAATSFTPTLDPNTYGDPFKARTGKQYEAGVKVQPAGSESLFGLAVFDLTQRNTLTADPDQVNHPFGQVQTGEFRSRGLELEAKTALTKSLSLVGSYTYLDPKFTRSNSDNLGNGPKGVPHHGAALWADYKVARGVSVGAGVRHVGERPSSDSAAERYMLPAFTLVDAAVRYEFDKVELALNVNNLTNKVTQDCWGPRCWYGPARSVVGTVAYRW